MILGAHYNTNQWSRTQLSYTTQTRKGFKTNKSLTIYIKPFPLNHHKFEVKHKPHLKWQEEKQVKTKKG